MRVLFAESVQKMYKSDKYLHAVPTTCRKLGSRTINPCNSKNLFLEHSFHINCRKSHEISAKLNDLVKSYYKKSNRGDGAEAEEDELATPPTPPPTT